MFSIYFRSIDFTNALLMKGVVEVITADDIPVSKGQLRDEVFAKILVSQVLLSEFS